ncbi:MAG: hypothetical protein LBT97_10485 [Planctomycetota bacterium]|jgi:hypothetical protein|nr:hypothetical protein [Planctomycetota bacterium]
MEEVNSYIDGLRAHYRKQVNRFIKEIAQSASEKKMSELIFEDIRGELETLEKDIQSGKAVLDRLNHCLGELNQLEET